MNKSNNRYLGLASVSLFVGLSALACGSDDDDVDNTTAGKTSTGGKSTTGGKSSTGGSAGKTGTGGSVNVSGNSSGGAGGDGAGGEGGAVSAPKARLRVVHASANAPGVDIYAKDAAEAAVTGVDYGEATDYIEVDAGTIAFDLRAAGDEATAAPAFTTEDIELVAGADYTLVAAGDFSQPEDADVGFRVLALEHDFDTAAAGTVVARIVHATTAWDAVDLDVVATTGVDVPALDRFASESNVVLDAAVVAPIAFQTETGGDVSQLTLPKLTAGNELFVIATGNPGFPFRAPANGFALLVVDQDGNVSWVKENPWLHLVHASDVGSVDVYESTKTAVGARLVNDLAAEAITHFQLPASATGFTLKAVAGNAASGAATELASGATSTIAVGEHYLSYIAGDTLQTIHEQFDLEKPTKVVLRGVHASVDIAQTVNFGTVLSDALNGVLINGVMPTESSAEAGIVVNPGTISLGASAVGSTVLLAQTTLTSTTAPIAGERDFVLLVGAGELWVVDTSKSVWTVR